MVDAHGDAFRALGRYVAVFSALVAIMRNLFATRIAGQVEQEREILDFALGGLTAEPIANAFFAACRTLASLDKDERAIETCLRKAVLEEIKRRNDIVHGDWLFDERGERGPRSVLLRVKAGSVRQDPLRMTEYTAEEIEAICGEVETLYSLVWEFAAVALRPHGDEWPGREPLPERIADALQIVDGQVRFQPGVAVPRWNG